MIQGTTKEKVDVIAKKEGTTWSRTAFGQTIVGGADEGLHPALDRKLLLENESEILLDVLMSPG